MKGNRTSNRGMGFSTGGWKRISEFNERAADPDDTEVEFTYKKNPQLASENGKKRKGWIAPPHVKKRMSISAKLRVIKKRIASGESVTDEDIAWAQNIVSSAEDAKLDIQATIQDLENTLLEIDDPVDRARALAVLAHNKREAYKLNHEKVESDVKKVIDVDTVNKLLLEKQKERDTK